MHFKHRCQLSIFGPEDSVLHFGGQTQNLEDIWRTSGHFGGHLEDKYKIEINSSKISCSYINITVPALETIKCSLLPFKKLNIQA